MEPHDLTLDVREAGIVVGGELDASTTPRLTEALKLFIGRTVRPSRCN